MSRPPNESYLSAEIGIRSWLLTTDHKRIALLYFATITAFFAIGGMAARRRESASSASSTTIPSSQAGG